MEKRTLGNSEILVTPVAMGCWPISGMTSLNVTEKESQRTLDVAFDSGINFFDTAYCYGVDGLSDRLLGNAALARREQFIIAAKCGIHWDEQVNKVIDGTPERLMLECDQSLSRLQSDYVDLMYLHRTDPNVPIEESASAFAQMKKMGKTRSVGVSNVTLAEAKKFHAVCPVVAIQLPYNMLEREIESKVLPWCRNENISAIAYWPLMKGLLAGRIRRDFEFESEDKRQSYPQFQGEQWDRNQDLIDALSELAAESKCSIAELVVAWTIHQPGITSALCGAKRDWQITETARVLRRDFDAQIIQAIEACVRARSTFG